MTGWMKLLEAKAFWGVDELQARLVAAVDERDAARKLYDERQDDWIVERQSLQELNAQLVKNHDAMQAERDAAQAGEARAVEALRKLANEADALRIEEYSIRELVGNTNWSCLRLRIDEARALDAQPALVWLAQQRREAAAEALENVRIGWLSDNDYRPGVPEIWRYIADRAAVLRAGATGGEYD